MIINKMLSIKPLAYIHHQVRYLPTFLFLCSFLSLINHVYAQNNAIRGIVKLQSSGSQPLSDVKISAFGANPVYSNSSGQFEMIFTNKKPGAAVNLFVLKEGFEVINVKELENVVIRENPDDLVIIVIAKMGERDKQALAYYDIIIDNTNNNYQKELNNIRLKLDALDEDDASRKALRDQIESLQQEKESLLEKAEELSKQLASVDMDLASDLAREAYENFKAGDIEAALAVLNDETLDKNLREAQTAKNRLKEKLMKSDSAIVQCIENFMIKARFSTSDRNYEEALKNYVKAIAADSTNVNNLMEAADFCNNINLQKKAIEFYSLAITLSKAPVKKARLLLKLGHQFIYDNNFDEAEKAYDQSLEWAIKSEKDDPDQHLALQADIFLAKGRMYLELNDDVKGEQAYLKSKTIILQLSAQEPLKYQPRIAEVHRALGDLYSKLEQFELSDSAFQESLKIYEHLAKIDPEKYQSSLAACYWGLAVFYARTRMYDEAEEAFFKSIKIYNSLSQENPFKYEPNLASVNMGLSVMYYHSGNYTKSESGYKSTIDIYQRLADENPRRYEPSLARVYLNLGSLYSTLEDYDQSEDAYNTSRLIRKRLAMENPERFDPPYCHLLLNMAFMKKNIFYEEYDMSQRTKALGLLAEVEEILSTYDPNIPWVKRYGNDVGAIKQFFIGVTEEDLIVQTEMDKVDQISVPEPTIENISNTIASQEIVIDSLEKIRLSYPDNQRLATRMSEAYGNIASYQVYARSFAKAEKAAYRGLALDEKEIWINSYLALALCYQGQVDKAIQIYKTYIKSQYNDYPMRDIFLEDLEALEAAGVIHKDTDALKALLSTK